VGRRLVSIGGVMCKTDIAIGITFAITGLKKLASSQHSLKFRCIALVMPHSLSASYKNHKILPSLLNSQTHDEEQ
jgi:hypothetical protein